MADEEDVPAGFIPLLITGPTQAIIECIIDENVTEEGNTFLISGLSPKWICFVRDLEKWKSTL